MVGDKESKEGMMERFKGPISSNWKKLALGLVIILSVVFAFVIWRKITIPTSSPRKYSQEVIDLCEKEKNLECDPDCEDGFGEIGYFDSRKYTKEELQSGFSLSEKAREASFAIRVYSACGECYNRFELKVNEEFREVSCEEFYRKIEEMNEACNDCVDKISVGCC